MDAAASRDTLSKYRVIPSSERRSARLASCSSSVSDGTGAGASGMSRGRPNQPATRISADTSASTATYRGLRVVATNKDSPRRVSAPIREADVVLRASRRRLQPQASRRAESCPDRMARAPEFEYGSGSSWLGVTGEPWSRGPSRQSLIRVLWRNPMMRSQRYRFLVTFILVMLSAAGAAAQEFRATIRGQVLDSSKAALPGVTVTAQNIETNEVATATPNAQGNYTIPFLRPGSYTLTADLQGFQKYTRSGLVLEVNQTATINMQLGLGGLTEEVNVTAESPLLETSNASRGTVIDNKRIAELPLQSRNPFALSVLVAGVNYNAQAIYLRPFDNGALADWSMNGGQNRNNEFLLDGAPNNANQGGNNIAYVPPADAVQEFKISTNSYDAQYGRTAGGVVNVSLKSGTNSFHGSVYDYMRRKALAANSFLLNSRNAPKTDQYIDQYGFSVDGPIFKNKTFFMFNGERYREGTPAPLISDVPTPAMKNGDFSGLVDAQGRLITIYDPATGRDVNGVWTRDPFPNNSSPPTASARWPGRSRSISRIRITRRPAWPRGRTTWIFPSTSTRTCSGTGSGKSITTSVRTIASSSAGARTSATRSGTRAPSGPVQRRTGSCRSFAPTAPSSATGSTSSVRAPC